MQKKVILEIFMKKNKQAFNPFLPSYEYVPDGEPYVFGDRVYVYGSHDRFNGKMFCVNDYVCWSAPIDDLGNWRHEGVIYKRTQDNMYNGKSYLYAPDVAKGTDGKYYLYYCLSKMSVTGVAVSDTPCGPFEFYGHVQNSKSELLWQNDDDPFQFDPAVFVDDDGKVYMYTGMAPGPGLAKYIRRSSNKSLDGAYVVELEPDMKTAKGEPRLISQGARYNKDLGYKGHEFFEASSMRKIKDSYYFIYSSINSHELCYATSKSPMGNFTYGGTIVSNADLFLNGHSNKKMGYNYGGNTHGSIVEVKGEWYVFYHRHTNHHGFSRQAMAEKINVLEDGTIPQVEITSCGLNGKPLIGKGEYEARIACHLMSPGGTGAYGFIRPIRKKHPYFTQSGVDREENPDQYIANFFNGCKAGFKYFDIDDLKTISVKIQGKASGSIYVLDSIVGKYVSRIDITPTTAPTIFTGDINITNGRQELYFQFEGEGSFNFYSIIMD